MPTLSESESRVLADLSRETLWQNAETLASWQKVSGTPDERAAVEYLKGRLEEYGLETSIYEVECLLGWPLAAAVEVRSPAARSMRAITHSLVPSTVPEGLEGELIYLGPGEEADYRGRSAAGKIVLVDGLASPDRVEVAQKHGAVAALFASSDDHIRDCCVSPVWGTPTPRTADLLPKIPVASIGRPDGLELKALLEQGAVRVWLRTETFLGWKSVPILEGVIPGAVEPEKFVLFSGHHDSWYYGAMDNGAANATMLETARILSARRSELRRGVKFAFWPAHTQGRYAGSAWYADRFWEDLYDNCVLHINADSTGAKGAEFYHARCMAENRDFALAAIQDAVGAEAEPFRMPRAADQSFWALGIPSMFMSLSKVPPEISADLGGTRILIAAEVSPLRKKGGMPWWWHTPDDTIDKIDPDVLKGDTSVFLLATWRAATAPVLPFRYRATAREIREILMKYQAAAGDRLDLGPTIARAGQVEAAIETLDGLLDRVRRQPAPEGTAAIANRGLMALGRTLTMIDFTAAGPFDQDLAVPVPTVPLLEPALRLAELDPASDESRFLATELTRNRNKVAFYLREALNAATETAAALGEASR